MDFDADFEAEFKKMYGSVPTKKDADFDADFEAEFKKMYGSVPTKKDADFDADFEAEFKKMYGSVPTTTQKRAPWGLRPDGTPKGSGYFGVLKNANGDDVTEFSVGVNIDGKEMDIPTLVPTLNDDEKQQVLDASAGLIDLPEGIVKKAADFARSRLAKGKSVWADKNDSFQVPITTNAEAKAKGKLGIKETAQKDFEAATGIDAPENGFLAQVANMGTVVGGKLTANTQMRAAQRLMAGDYDAGEEDSLMDELLYGSVAQLRQTDFSLIPGRKKITNKILKEWDEREGRQYKDAAERTKARKAYAQQIATNFVKERSGVQQNAETELANRDTTHSANIVSRGLGMVGYSLPYALGPLGITLQFLEEGSANAVGYKNDRYGYDDDGNFILLSKGDSTGRAIAAGFGTAGFETATELVGGKIGGAIVKRALKLGGKGIGALAGKTIGRIPLVKKTGEVASEWGGKAVDKFEATKAGKFLERFGKGLLNVSKWTSKKFHLESYPEENIEELESAIFNALTGFDRRASELVDPETGERTNPWGRFVDANKEFFSKKNLAQLNEAMLLTMGTGAFIAKCAQYGNRRAVDNLIRENNLMTEAEIKDTPLDKKAAALDAWRNGLSEEQVVAKLDKATSWVDKLSAKIAGESGKYSAEVNAIREKMAATNAYATGKELAELNIPEQKFNIKTKKGKNGKTVPDFQRVKVMNATTGETMECNAVYDESGISVVDNGVKKRKSGAAYTVFIPGQETGHNFMSLDKAITFATRAKNEIALDYARDNMKIEFISKMAEKDYGGANVVCVKTAAEAVEVAKKRGYDITKSSAYDAGRAGFHLADGTVVLVRDNINSPQQAERLLRHENIGHSEEMMKDKWLNAGEKSEIGTLRDANMKAANKNGSVSAEEVERIKRESVANTVQMRPHVPSAGDRIVHGVRQALRSVGLNLNENDVDMDVVAAGVEKAMRKGKDGSYVSVEAVPLSELVKIVADAKKAKKQKKAAKAATEEAAVKAAGASAAAPQGETANTAPQGSATNAAPQGEAVGDTTAAQNGTANAAPSAAPQDSTASATTTPQAETTLQEEGKTNDFESERPNTGKEEPNETRTNANEESAQPQSAEAQQGPQAEKLEGSAAAEGVVNTETEKSVASRSVIEKMTDKAPVEEIPVAEVVNDDTRIPNFKEGANPETGEVEPLTGEPYDLVSNPIVVMEFKDGKKVVVTGRHRLALYKRNGRDKIAARVIREADGWTVDDARTIDSIGNIIDEKGTVKDYVKYFENAKPSRAAAESGGFLSRPKGKLAFGIYEGASEDTRSFIDWEGSGTDGMISPEQAGIIAEAAPKNAHPRFSGVQKILVAKAKNGLRGTKLGILARSLAEEVKNQKEAPRTGGVIQLDFFTSPEDLALIAMEEKRADYRARKSREYKRIAEILRTAMSKGGKLELNKKYARELNITNPKNKEQLATARDTAANKAYYWEHSVQLDKADKEAMDAEIAASAKNANAGRGGKSESTGGVEEGTRQEDGGRDESARAGAETRGSQSGKEARGVAEENAADNGYTAWLNKYRLKDTPARRKEYAAKKGTGVKVDSVKGKVKSAAPKAESRVETQVAPKVKAKDELKVAPKAEVKAEPKVEQSAETAKTTTVAKAETKEAAPKVATPKAKNQQVETPKAMTAAPKTEEATSKTNTNTPTPKAAGKTLSSEENAAKPVTASVEFGAYNSRRYSKPWIAKVTAWDVGELPVIKFGNYIGDDNGGRAEIAAKPGDVVRYGQEDYRRNGTKKQYGVVQADGSVLDCSDDDAALVFRGIIAPSIVKPAAGGVASSKTATKTVEPAKPAVEPKAKEAPKSERSLENLDVVSYNQDALAGASANTAYEAWLKKYSLKDTPAHRAEFEKKKGQEGAPKAKAQAPAPTRAEAVAAMKLLGMDAGLPDAELKAKVREWERHANDERVAKRLDAAKTILADRAAKGKAELTDEDKVEKAFAEAARRKGKFDFDSPEYARKGDSQRVTPEEDAAYLDAVKRGDMETAKELLKAVWERNGYAPEQGYMGRHAAPRAPISNTYFQDKSRLAQANEEGLAINLWAIANGVSPVPADFFTADGYRRYTHADKAGAEAQTALSTVLQEVKNGNDKAAITVYRAVPNSVRGDSLQSGGQWVSPSRTYADEHGATHFGNGEYKIVAQKVNAANLWWDGNDIREWGYDDGKQYVYQNAPNGMKLATVTYDDAGNVIPLSERFNPQKEDVRFDSPEYARKEQAEQARREYDEVVRQYTNANGSKRRGWMKAPNGKDTNLTERQWVQVRTPSFKRWFGDWETLAETADVRTAKSVEDAMRIAREAGVLDEPIENNHLGIAATISNTTLEKMGSEKATKKSISPRLHTLAIANIDKLFASATLEYTHPDTHGRAEVEQTRRLGTAMRDPQSGEFVPVMLTVLEYKKDGKRIYTVEAIDIEKYKNSAGQLVASAESERQTPIAEFANSIAHFAENINPNAVSKVVDENGEPRVVYHGTKQFGFSVFAPEFSDDGKSVFATSSERVAGSYAGVQGKVRNIKDGDTERLGPYEAIEKLFSECDISTTDSFADALEMLSDTLGINVELADDERSITITSQDSGESYKWEQDNKEEEVFKWLTGHANTWLLEDADSDVGIYALYFNLRKPLIVDGRGSIWSHINKKSIPGMKGVGSVTTREIAKFAKEHGYDGVVIKEIADQGAAGFGLLGDAYSDIYISFAGKSAIKSATENSGAYSAAEDDILFDSPELSAKVRAEEIKSYSQRYYSRHRGLARLAKPTTEDFMDAAEGRWSKFRRAVQDKNLVIREVEERLGITDKKHSVYYAKDREFGLNEWQLGVLDREFIRPIFEKLAATGASQQDLDLYLMARHAPSRNAVLRERGVENGAGMSDAEAADVLKHFREIGITDEFDEIAQMVYKMNEQALQRRVDSGRISVADAEALRKQFTDYVPLRTDMENDERDAHNTYSSGWHLNEFHMAKGRKTLADSPLSWSIVQAERSIKDANANTVRQVAAELVRKANKMGHPIGEIIPGRQVKHRWAFQLGTEVLTLEELRDRPDLIFFKEGGKLKAIRMFTGEHGLGNTFAKAVTDKDLARFNKWFEWVPQVTRFFSAMRTQYVPTFIVRNMKADHIEVLLNSLTERGLTSGTAFFGRLIKCEAQNAKDVRDFFRYGKLRGRMKEFVENGGLTGGGMSAEGFTEVEKRLASTLKDAKRNPVMKAIRSLGDLISWLNACAEYNTRVAVFSALREQGVGVEDAVSYARDATVNFNRKGFLTPYINAAYMFSNAAIQGLGRAFKPLREHPKRAAGTVTSLVLLGMIQGFVEYFAGGDDDDKEKKEGEQKPEATGLSNVRNLSEYSKQSEVSFPLGKSGLMLKARVRNPFALPIYLGRKVAETIVKQTTPKKAVADVASAVGGFITEPVGGNGFGSVSEALQTLAPTMIDPFVQWATGTDFTGTPRVKRVYNDYKPVSFNGRNSTPFVYKWLAQSLNSISGGNEFRKGALDTAPENWKLLAETALGGVLTDIGRTVSTAQDAWQAAKGEKPDQVMRDIPFVRDWVTNYPDVRNRYYEMLKEYEANKAEYKGLNKGETRPAAKAIKEEQPWVKGKFDDIIKDVKELGEEAQDERDPLKAKELQRKQLEKMEKFVRQMDFSRRPEWAEKMYKKK